jgi:hypothetical protein
MKALFKREGLSLILMMVNLVTFAGEYHVAKTGNDSNDGNAARPFLTINRAVNFAVAGDTVTVHEGTYREWVKPLTGGESDLKRIVYRAAPGEIVHIKGSEVIPGWKKDKNWPGVWSVCIPNTFFRDYNPYRDSIYGDWFNKQGRIHHTGEVFLNGKSLYEKETLQKVREPIADSSLLDPEGSTYTWYCESNDNETTIWANFHKSDPNNELIEISTRKTCIYPEMPGINYITICGFRISQAATQWGAPTAEQVGMVATHWNKGWIIENNIISDSKCSGITLGKERGTGHNVWSADQANVNNDGNIHYIEVIFRVLRNGWSKQNTGGHIIRNNTIYNCEQTGICGSMGAAFSIIENNHIYNIYTKRQFSGAEIGGIKFHAAIDAVIRHNRIHDTGRGIWLDWMSQGTRVTSNLFYHNDMEDVFFEVNHGPFIVDNNIFLSHVSIRSQSEGGAFVHNLITGLVQTWPDPNRFTPYFLPHSTDIAGLTTVMGGDDRLYNNIIVGIGKSEDNPYGLHTYDNAKLPVFIENNAYLNCSLPSRHEINMINYGTFDPCIKLDDQGECGYLHMAFGDAVVNASLNMVDSQILGKAKIPKAAFENSDGTAIEFDTDISGNTRHSGQVIPGPFAKVKMGKNIIQLW